MSMIPPVRCELGTGGCAIELDLWTDDEEGPGPTLVTMDLTEMRREPQLAMMPAEVRAFCMEALRLGSIAEDLCSERVHADARDSSAEVPEVADHEHDTDEPCPACAWEWQLAGSLSELQELTARFIEGRLRAHPGYLAATVDAETEGIAADLAAINRGGLLTDCSQPGMTDGTWVQRAWVSGYCTEAEVDALLAGCLATDLLVLALPPGNFEGPRVCITRDGAAQHSWAGLFEDPVHEYEPALAELEEELADLWCVDIMDPVWGRNDLLWPTVRAALAERPTEEFTH